MVRAGPVQFPVVLRRGGRKKGGNTKLLPEIAKNGKKITGKCQRKTGNRKLQLNIRQRKNDRVGKKGNVKLVSRRVGNSLFRVQKQCHQALSTRVETDRQAVVCMRVGYM